MPPQVTLRVCYSFFLGYQEAPTIANVDCLNARLVVVDWAPTNNAGGVVKWAASASVAVSVLTKWDGQHVF